MTKKIPRYRFPINDNYHPSFNSIDVKIQYHPSSSYNLKYNKNIQLKLTPWNMDLIKITATAKIKEE